MEFQYPGEMKLLPVNYVLDLHDVICGRGKKCFNHYGNECFRKVIEARLDEYTNAASKIEKTMIIREIIANIRAKTPEGGFVKYDPIKKRYFEIGETLAREKTSQAFRDALYGGIRMNSAVKVKRTIVGTTRKSFIQNPIDKNKNKASESFGFTKEDLIRQQVLDYSHEIQKARNDSQYSLRMDNGLGMPPPRTISPSLSSKGSSSSSLSNAVNYCDDISQSFSTLYKNTSTNHDHTVRTSEWKRNDRLSDRRHDISDQSKFDINSNQCSQSYKKHGFNGLVSWFEHSNDEASKPSFHRSEDAFAPSSKQDEESRIHDYYTSQINDILFNRRRIQKSLAQHHQQQRRCSIDGLIQAFEIGDIDPFEPTPYDMTLM